MKFTCPKCGGHYFSRDVSPEGKTLPSVRCNGESSEGNRTCDWRGDWPPIRTVDSLLDALRRVAEAKRMAIPERALREIAETKVGLQDVGLRQGTAGPAVPSDETLRRWIRESPTNRCPGAGYSDLAAATTDLPDET